MIKQVITYSDAVTSLHATPEGLWIGHQGINTVEGHIVPRSHPRHEFNA
jgi:hypothetical protein